MIKLALPPYNPEERLRFDFVFQVFVSANTYSEALYPPVGDTDGTYPTFDVELYGGDFTQWVRAKMDDIVVAPGTEGLTQYRTAGGFNRPAERGLSGGEGWFQLRPSQYALIFVTDCIVTYTPVGAHGVKTAHGYFS